MAKNEKPRPISTIDRLAVAERRAGEIIEAARARIQRQKVLKYAVHVLEIETGHTVSEISVDGGDIRKARKLRKEIEISLDHKRFVTKIIAI